MTDISQNPFCKQIPLGYHMSDAKEHSLNQLVRAVARFQAHGGSFLTARLFVHSVYEKPMPPSSKPPRLSTHLQEIVNLEKVVVHEEKRIQRERSARFLQRQAEENSTRTKKRKAHEIKSEPSSRSSGRLGTHSSATQRVSDDHHKCIKHVHWKKRVREAVKKERDW